MHNLDITKYFVKTSDIELLKNSSQLMSVVSKGYLCLDNLGKGDIYSPEILRKCRIANYYENNDTYECISCIDGYSLDEETKTCKQSIKVSMNLRPGFSNCYVRNIGDNQKPIYSCYSCYNRKDLLIESDTGAKFCASKTGELAGCTEAYADTTYLNNVYNCTYCDLGYISYYNIFFEKITCQDIRYRPEKEREFDSTIFNPEEVEHVSADENGQCQNAKLFTPDKKNCYACNNRTVGMVGCKGTCEFNPKKNITLKCEEGMCKTGFIEKTKGVCEPCETINEGCIECHYENDYLSGYYGFKRKRRFSCDQCDNGYLISEDGTCHHCSTLGFTNCKNCGVDPAHDNEIMCVECQPGYFINDEGKCIYCSKNQIKGKDNTCILCDDVESGGIEGCQECHNVDNEPQCTICKPGFILLENNHTCLRISSNIQLEELPHCKLVYFNESENYFECKQCEKNFVLLEENGKIKCFNEEFIPSINVQLCGLFENLGTEDIPKYSCAECRKNETEEISWSKDALTKITYQENNTAICEYRYKYNSITNCTEADMIIEDGVTKLNCTECIEDNILYHHKDTDLHICKYKYFEKQCVVKYCKTCTPGNNYFCSECLPSNYEVSPLTGACIRKTESTPSVYFKDIFRLKYNQQKQIGARMLYGPFLSLRGLTNSQINTGHAFLVLLSFKLHYTEDNRNRNLEEDKSIKTYCQIVESVDETSDEPNVVDFDCIGDTEEEEDLSEYQLNAIEESAEDNSNGMLEGSNLNELAQNTDLSLLATKTKTSFDLKNFIDLAVFSPDDDVKNITSDNYQFNFKLNGTLNKELKEDTLTVQIPINQIKDKNVNCSFNIRVNKTADLECNLNFDQHRNENYTYFSFKVIEVKDNSDTPIYLSKINEFKLIHGENKTVEQTTSSSAEEKEEKNNKVVIIVIASVLGGIGVLVGLAFLLRWLNCNCTCSKRRSIPDTDRSANVADINKVHIPDNIQQGESLRRVVPYQNYI